MKKILAAAVIALTVVGGAAVASAGTAGGQETEGPGSSSGETTTARRHHARAARHRTVHADLVVKTKDGFTNVTVDRGRLTAVEGNALTITRPDGVVVHVTVDDATKYRGISGASELQEGKPVIVRSHDGTAKAVAQRKPGAQRKRAAAAAPTDGASA